MKTILVPTDFSPTAANALRFAFELATRTGAEIVVLNVVFPSEGADNNVYATFWTEAYFAERRKTLAAWMRRQQRAATAPKITVRTESVVGFPTQTILETAEKYQTNLIVMGAIGATGLAGTLLGSVAVGVVGRARVPVLVVSKKGKLRGQQTAVLATDFHLQADVATLGTMRELLALYPGTLKILHVLDRPDDRPSQEREQALSRQLADIPHDFHYLHDRDAPQATVNFLETIQAGLLIVVAHEHGFLHRVFHESFTRRLAKRIIVPMLVLHDK